MATEDWVTITHPSDPARKTALVSRAAFEEVYSLPKISEDGETVAPWELVDPAVAVASEILGKQIGDLNSLTKEELVALGSQKGVAVDPDAKKTDVLAAVSGALTEVTSG